MSVIAAMSREQMEGVFCQISGLPELLSHRVEMNEQTAAQYPEAAFVYRLVTEPFHHDNEINQINYRAIRSILNGESVANVQHRHDREFTNYMTRHMWDD